MSISGKTFYFSVNVLIINCQGQMFVFFEDEIFRETQMGRVLMFTVLYLLLLLSARQQC